MPRSVRWVVSISALLAAACGAFSGAEEDAAPSPVPSAPDAGASDGATAADEDATAPLGGDDAGPPPSTCASPACGLPGGDCASADFTAGAVPDGWALRPKENPPFVTQGLFLRSTGKLGIVSFAKTGDMTMSSLVTVTIDLDFRVVQLKPGNAALGFVAFRPRAETDDVIYAAARPDGKLTFCTRFGTSEPSCTADLGAWTKDTWHHLRWTLDLVTDAAVGVKGTVAIDCKAPAAFEGPALPLVQDGAMAFLVGAPVYPSFDPYAVDVDNFARLLERTK